MVKIRAMATGSGLIINWLRFKKGELVPCSRWSCLLTTVLTDVVTDLIDCAIGIDPTCTVTPLFPNGFTTTTFVIAIKGKGFLLICARRLVRGLFPLNPIAAEFGRNYDVLITVTADTPEVAKRIIEEVRRKYVCSIEMDTEPTAGANGEDADAQP
jgi:hypothetical protein